MIVDKPLPTYSSIHKNAMIKPHTMHNHVHSHPSNRLTERHLPCLMPDDGVCYNMGCVLFMLLVK